MAASTSEPRRPHPAATFPVVLAVALFVAFAAAPLPAADEGNWHWQEYHARYAVYRNGKLAGKAEFSLRKLGEGDRWAIRSEAYGTHGMARLLGARDVEHAEVTVRDGRFRPDEFLHQTRVAGIDNRWTADFDWEAGRVEIVEGREERVFDLPARTLDPLSLKLEMQRRLRAGDTDLAFHLVDEDEIEQQRYRLLEPERLETSLGCLDTLPVERVRTGSSRYTRAWHAPELDFVTVRLEHGKTGGDHMEMRITELVIEGEAVTPDTGCIAYQGSP